MQLKRRALRDQDAGAIAVLTALAMLVMLIAVAFAVDIGRWYVEGQRLQRAADAAALAGVPYMPDDLAQATNQARATVIANGYASGTFPAGNVVEITGTSRPSELKVTTRSRIPNIFASVIGLTGQTLTRTAVADYTGPAPMGSPCNLHGNEPDGTVLPGGQTTCTSDAGFWATVVGPHVYKTQGDRFSPRYCGAGEDECSGPGNKTNDDHRPQGYAIILRVRDAAAVGALRIQLYDPAYIDTASRCDATGLPERTDIPNTVNGFPDAKLRYGRTLTSGTRAEQAPSEFCNGDNDNDRNSYAPNGTGVNDTEGEEVPTITSFGLIKPTDTFNPYDPGANGNTGVVSNRICSVQYPGYSLRSGSWRGGDGTGASLTAASTGGSAGQSTALRQIQGADLRPYFHRWVDFCTFTPNSYDDPLTPGVNEGNGDYYLRVRTDIPLGAGNATRVFSQTGDDSSVIGNGSNRFAVRVQASSPADISISPYERMPIFANKDASEATFFLLRVPPGAAGQNLLFTMFDGGDARCRTPAGDSCTNTRGTVTILPPTGATGDVAGSGSANAPRCTAQGSVVTGDLTGCQLTGVLSSGGSPDWNGKLQRVTVPIPLNYGCDVANPLACWFRLRVNFNNPNMEVTDQTTWTATLDGDPVRLVK